jgi:hypothetical protein
MKKIISSIAIIVISFLSLSFLVLNFNWLYTRDVSSDMLRLSYIVIILLCSHMPWWVGKQ